VLEKEATEVAAPKLAARPKGRPKRAEKTPDVKVAAAPKPQTAETETSAPAPEVKSPTAEPAPAAGRYVLGSDMSRNEKFAISGQIENRWNIASFEGRPNWETLVENCLFSRTSRNSDGTTFRSAQKQVSGRGLVAHQV